MWSGVVRLQCHRLTPSTLGSSVEESFMGAKDDQWLCVGAHEHGQIHMGVTTDFFTLLGSTYGLGKKEGG